MEKLIYRLLFGLITLLFCGCGNQKETDTTKNSRIEKNVEMMEKYDVDGKVHQYLAIELNNQTWNLLTKENRTAKDEKRMVAYALGSQYHWFKSPGWQPVNAQRGEWLVAHVYAIIGDGENALFHSKKCMELTEKFGFKDFDLAYAYEGLARANAVSGNREVSTKYKQLAGEAGEKIKETEDKELFFSDLEAEPWYGVK